MGLESWEKIMGLNDDMQFIISLILKTIMGLESWEKIMGLESWDWNQDGNG